jgi:hypothetical protein
VSPRPTRSQTVRRRVKASTNRLTQNPAHILARDVRVADRRLKAEAVEPAHKLCRHLANVDALEERKRTALDWMALAADEHGREILEVYLQAMRGGD